jgi:serine/threonine protein kinase
MKMLDKDKIQKENLEDDVMSEVRSMKLVNHPYIVRFYEVLKTNKKILLIMEYIDDGDLFDAIRSEINNRMSESKARVYFQQIILAIQYLHNKNIIHRDLKPENILIDKKKNCIKITDFGLSTLIKRKYQLLPDIAGTTDYLAPEVIKQTGYLGQSADIWSCGVILFNCVTGYKPFVGRNTIMLNNILTGNIEFPKKNIPGNLKYLIKKILDPNPETRYNIQQIMNNEWFKVGFDKVEKEVKNYFKNSFENTNLETIEFKEKKSIDFFININKIPLINAFNFGLLLYGNKINDFFNINKKVFNEMKNYKFIYNKDAQYFGQFFKNYFIKKNINLEFNYIEIDKFNVNLKNFDCEINIILQIFKISNNGKIIYVITYKNGNIEEYYNLFNMFFNENKDIINKI